MTLWAGSSGLSFPSAPVILSEAKNLASSQASREAGCGFSGLWLPGLLNGFPMKNVGNDRCGGRVFGPLASGLRNGFPIKNVGNDRCGGWVFGPLASGLRNGFPMKNVGSDRWLGFRNSGFQVAESREQIRMA